MFIYLLSTAEGYEQLARLRENPISSRENGSQAMNSGEDILADGATPGVDASIFDRPLPGLSSSNSAGQVPSTANDDTYDMFADDDDNAESNTGNSFQGTRSIGQFSLYG